CPSHQPWTLDESVLQDVRSNVAAKLLYLKYPSRYPDPERQDTDGGTDGGGGTSGGGCGCQTVAL
ncbi:MAG: hypothetical protein WC889_06430, partial [Myxococcota bacterium]